MYYCVISGKWHQVHVNFPFFVLECRIRKKRYVSHRHRVITYLHIAVKIMESYELLHLKFQAPQPSSLDVQVDLSQTWSETLKTGFLVMRRVKEQNFNEYS